MSEKLEAIMVVFSVQGPLPELVERNRVGVVMGRQIGCSELCLWQAAKRFSGKQMWRVLEYMLLAIQAAVPAPGG